MTKINQTKFRQGRWMKSILILLGLLLILFIILGFKTYSVYVSDLPSFEQLHNIEPSLKTKIFDRNGIPLKEFYSENRVLTPFSKMPSHLVEILLASEDREFFDHWGMNVRRIFVVAAYNLIKMRIAAGASTISQQLARMLFLTRKQTFERKFKEALTAIKLERTYSKEEILEMYLNQYYFGRGSYGIAAASHVFFSKDVSELNINDCAILIGMLKAPNKNSPFTHPDRALRARNRVLYSYYTFDGIDKTTYDSLVNEELVISPPEEKLGIAPYFTETIRQYIYDRYGENMLYSGGLKVFTSLDAGHQRAAEAGIAKKVGDLRARIECG